MGERSWELVLYKRPSNQVEFVNIMERGIEIELDMLISMIEVMLSGPGDACEVT